MSSVVQQIIPHIQSVFNCHINKYVNTGDRILDTALIGLCTILFTTCINYMWPYLDRVVEWIHFMSYYFCQENDETSHTFNIQKVDPSVYTKEEVEKYTYIKLIEQPSSKKKILKYVLDNKYSSILKHIQLNNNNELTSSCDNASGLKIYDTPIPIYKYKQDNKVQYIILYKNCLCSNHSDELIEFSNKFDVDHKNQNENKYVYSFCTTTGMKTICSLNTRKNKDSLHFSEMDSLFKMIDKFKSGTMYPTGLSLDNKLGIILHGPPGTGKTGTCMAIANYLNRDILLLSSLVSGRRDAIVDTVKQYQKTHVIVLDEFDYILNQHEQAENDYGAINYTELMVHAKTPEERAQIKKEMLDAKTNISDEEFLLKLLDSFGDDSDRIIIATTNSIQKINPKYMRPGRFDMICLLGYCTRSMFRNISVSVYKNIDEFMELDKERIDKALERNITPVVLINTLIKTSSFDELLDALCKLPVQTYSYPEF